LPIAKWQVPKIFKEMPSDLRASICNFYRLEVFTRSKEGKFTQEAVTVPPPIPSFDSLGLPKVL
jgi:hypothetical protein